MYSIFCSTDLILYYRETHSLCNSAISVSAFEYHSDFSVLKKCSISLKKLVSIYHFYQKDPNEVKQGWF